MVQLEVQEHQDGSSTSNTSSLSSDEKEVFDLINKQRTNNAPEGTFLFGTSYNITRVIL